MLIVIQTAKNAMMETALELSELFYFIIFNTRVILLIYFWGKVAAFEEKMH